MLSHSVVYCGMMPDQYKNIKITPEVFERLQRNKPDGESWSRYLDRLHEDAHEWRNRKSDIL